MIHMFIPANSLKWQSEYKILEISSGLIIYFWDTSEKKRLVQQPITTALQKHGFEKMNLTNETLPLKR